MCVLRVNKYIILHQVNSKSRIKKTQLKKVKPKRRKKEILEIHGKTLARNRATDVSKKARTLTKTMSEKRVTNLMKGFFCDLEHP